MHLVLKFWKHRWRHGWRHGRRPRGRRFQPVQSPLLSVSYYHYYYYYCYYNYHAEFFFVWFLSHIFFFSRLITCSSITHMHNRHTCRLTSYFMNISLFQPPLECCLFVSSLASFHPFEISWIITCLLGLLLLSSIAPLLSATFFHFIFLFSTILIFGSWFFSLFQSISLSLSLSLSLIHFVGGNTFVFPKKKYDKW